MPTYCMNCNQCGREVEIFKKMADKWPTKCPHCNSPESLTKGVTAPASIKGSGGGWCGSGGTKQR